MHLNFEAKINFVSFKGKKRIKDSLLCMLKLQVINVGDMNKVGVNLPIFFHSLTKTG